MKFIYKEFNQKIADAYNNSVPFFVITEGGQKFLDYKEQDLIVIHKIEEQRRLYIENNYPEFIVPF